MTPVTIARGLWWCGCLLVLLNAGCARWGYKHAEKQNIDRALSDDEASFVETPLARTQPIPPPTAKPAAQRTPEDEALIDDTLARLRTLPDMPPEKVDSIAKELRNPTAPLPRMMLQQINAMAKFEQEKAQQKAAAKTAALADANAAAAPAAQAATPETKPAAPPVAEAKPAEAKPAEATPAALTNPAQPVAPASAAAPAPAATVAPAATTAPPTDNKATSSAAAEPVEPTSDTPISAPTRSLRDRLRKARESTTPSDERGIFDGKVGANLPPQIDPEQFAVAHITHKPATLANAAASAVSAGEDAQALAWDKHVAHAIESLEAELESDALDTADAARLATQLRLLYLVADRKDDALRTIDELETYQQEYWRSQLHSLSLSLAADGTPVKGRRAALALRPLREAVDHLASGATLDVKNVALCKSVSMWGNFTEFDEYTFKPNQEVLLYFEVENFVSESTSKGYATEFVSSYEIFDETGRRVAEQQFPTAQETCQNRRRDYFIRYHLHMPKMLTSGDYTLQLTVEDQKGHKFGQGSVKFKVSS